MKHLMLMAASALILAACSEAAPPAEAPADPVAETAATEAAPVVTLADIVNSDLRSAEEKARDDWRNPAETLEFFGIEADDKVVEIWPGGGWYTNILAPWLASGGGTLVAAGFDPASVEDPERRAQVEGRIAEFKSTYADPRFGTIEYSAFSAVSGPLTEAGTADAVLTFRNIHNWMSGGYTEKFFTDAYTALKPGGVLGVVDHRARTDQPAAEQLRLGYVREDVAVAAIEAAGFRLDARSEVNANPRDTKDHPEGVWTLPPTLRLKDRDRERWLAIGESDRFTLRFVRR